MAIRKKYPRLEVYFSKQYEKDLLVEEARLRKKGVSEFIRERCIPESKLRRAEKKYKESKK